MRKLMASLALGGLLVAGSVAAAPPAALVDVVIVDAVDVGDITVVVQDVNLAVALDVAAQVCGVQIGNVAILANQVARSGQATACTLADGDQVLIQR